MDIIIWDNFRLNLNNHFFDGLEIRRQNQREANNMNNENESLDKSPKYNLKGIQAHRSCPQIMLDSSLKFKTSSHMELLAIKKVFVTNLADKTTQEDLSKLFQSYGEVNECVIKKNKKSNYAFVTFRKCDSAIKVLKEILKLDGKDLTVIPADPCHQPYPKKPPNITEEPKTNQIESSTSCTEFYPLVHKISDNCLIHIFQYLTIAERVKIERVCRRWRDLSLDSWRSVRRLDVNSVSWGCKTAKIETSDLYQILKRCGRFITMITFFENHRMMPLRTLFIIGKLCPNLKIAYLGTLEVTPREIDYLLSKCANLEFLEFDSFHFRDHDFRRLFAKSNKLTYASFEGNKVDGSCFTSLPEDVETFVFHDPKRRTEFYAFEFAVQKLKNLENLYLDFSNNSDAVPSLDEDNEDNDDNDDFQDDNDDFDHDDFDHDDFDHDDFEHDDGYDLDHDDFDHDDGYDLDDDNYHELSDDDYLAEHFYCANDGDEQNFNDDDDLFQDGDDNSIAESSDNQSLTFKTPDDEMLNSANRNNEDKNDEDDDDDAEDFNDISSTVTDVPEQEEINIEKDPSKDDGVKHSDACGSNSEAEIRTGAEKSSEDPSSASKTSENQSSASKTSEDRVSHSKSSEIQSSASKTSEDRTSASRASESQESASKTSEDRTSASKTSDDRDPGSKSTDDQLPGSKSTDDQLWGSKLPKGRVPGSKWSDNEASTSKANESVENKEETKGTKDNEKQKTEGNLSFSYVVDDFGRESNEDDDEDYCYNDLDDLDDHNDYDDYDDYDYYDEYDDYDDDDFDGFDVEDDFIFESHLAETIRKTLSHCSKKLKVLQLKSCAFTGLTSSDLSTRFTNFTNLERLDISCMRIVNDEILSAIGANCPKLSVLVINCCIDISDVGIGGIALLPELRHLSMTDLPRVTGKQLTTMSTLRTLYCARCPLLVEEGLDQLILNCQELEQLDLQFCKLITNSLIDIVSVALQNRTNNVKLKIFALASSIDVKNVTTSCELLEISTDRRVEELDSFVDGERGTEKTGQKDGLRLRDFRGMIFESSTSAIIIKED